MKTTTQNPPAFPLSKKIDGVGDVVHSGMTLRDYFAAKAMQVFAQDALKNDETDQMVADWSYQLADAMLVERESYE